MQKIPNTIPGIIIKNLNYSVTKKVNNEDQEFKVSLPLNNSFKNDDDYNRNYIKYVNLTGKFITVPQGMSDADNLDIYKNELVSDRFKL